MNGGDRICVSQHAIKPNIMVIRELHSAPLIWASDIRLFLLFGQNIAARNSLPYKKIFLIYGFSAYMGRICWQKRCLISGSECTLFFIGSFFNNPAIL